MNTIGSERETIRKVSNRYIFLRTAGLAFALFLTSQSVTAQEVVWPQFRGPNSNPVGANARLVDRWSKTENVEWSQEIPGRGWSSPIVTGQSVRYRRNNGREVEATSDRHGIQQRVRCRTKKTEAPDVRGDEARAGARHRAAKRSKAPLRSLLP